MEEDACGEVGEFFGVAMGFSSQSGQPTAKTIVMTFYREGVRLAFEMAASLEDDAVGMPEIGAIGDVLPPREVAQPDAGPFGCCDRPTPTRRLSWQHDQQPATAGNPLFYRQKVSAS
jgi:hypothetical protein